MEAYQDVWVTGEIERRGVRECASRYAAIQPLLRRYSRPFTLLDVGAAAGYFGFRIASEFPLSTVVLLEPDARLLDLCKRNALRNVVLLRHEITALELELLAACEAFDVVLGLNVLHHFADWSAAASAMLRLGDQIIVETPGAADHGACNQAAVPALAEHLARLGGTLLAETPSHTSATLRPMWLFNPGKPALERSYLDAPVPPVDCPRLTSSFERRTVTMKGETRAWWPGINLRTYQLLGGCYPARETVAEMIREYPINEHHGDVRPWNFLLDGWGVRLIDGNDERAQFDDEEGRTETLAQLRDYVIRNACVALPRVLGGAA